MPTSASSNSDLLVLLVRHAEREYYSTLQDWQQPITPKGLRSAHSLGEKLRHELINRNGPPPDGQENPAISIIFCSPFLRCKQTTDVLASYLSPKAGIHSAEALSLTPDEEALVAVRWTLKVLSSNLEAGTIILVGHEPELAAISQRLCGTSLILKKAEAAALELEAKNGLWQVGSARLLWRIKGK